MADELDLMIDEVRQRRRPDVPLYVTATEVLYEFGDEMSEATMAGLTAAGRQVIKDGGAVKEIPVKEESLFIYGFMALMSEQLMNEEEN